jgi:4a-hydroxytetrahydrobiopterin dehydratase
MNESELVAAHCTALPAGTPPLPPEAVARYLGFVPSWQLTDDGKSIRLQRRCEHFLDAVATLSKIAPLAEEEDHHPDVPIFSYRQLELVFSTHSIGGLSENDFIMAAKIDRLLSQP